MGGVFNMSLDLFFLSFFGVGLLSLLVYLSSCR